MKRLALILIALCLATVAAAQDVTDDRSRLVRFFEETLSDGMARQVSIEGFAGALDSTATLERLTIADADGVWLTIEDAELVWTRTALLRGALSIDRLSAARVILARLPVSGRDGPSPEATPFALPQLPVSVEIDALDIARIDIADPVLGFAARASLRGSARLVDGAGQADLALTRLDGPTGSATLQAAFSNETGALSLDLAVEEDPGGIAVALLGIPGDPSISLRLTGDGTRADFSADLSLDTDGARRLSGDLEITAEDTGARLILAALEGDLTPLMAAEFHPFFGDEAALNTRAVQDPDGALRVEMLDLRTAALQITGSGAIAADGAPQDFTLAGRIGGADQPALRLPIPSARVSVGAGEIALDYDRARSDTWRGAASLRMLEIDDFTLGAADLDLSGVIDPPGEGTPGLAARADITLSDLTHPDKGVQAAIGRAASLGFDLDWRQGGDLRLSDLSLDSDVARLTGSGRARLDGMVLDSEVSLAGDLPDLTAFSDVAGQVMTGTAEITLAATGDPLSGAFDAEITASGTGLGFGATIPPALVAGRVEIETELRRDTGGLTLEAFDLTAPAISLAASGQLASRESRLTATARMPDAGVLTPALSGPVQADLSVARGARTEPWTLQATLGGQGGLAADLSGQVGLPDGAVALDLTGEVPLAFADPFIAPNSVRGAAGFDLALRGTPGLGALNGRVTTQAARLTAPEAGVEMEQIALSADIAAGRATLQGSGAITGGGRVTAQGQVDLTSPDLPGRIEVDLAGVRLTRDDLFQSVIETGTLTLAGALAKGPALSGALNLGQTDIQLGDTSFGTAEPIPDIRHTGETAGQFATRDRAGLVARDGDGVARPLPLDLTITAPNRIFVRGQGLDAEFSGAVTIGGTTAEVLPSGQFDLIRGRLTILGQRLDLSEASVSLQDSFDPILRVVARTRAGDVTALVLLEGPASAPVLSLQSEPDLPEDEILAQLLFGRSAGSLSPVQALQMIEAASNLSGGSGLISGLRRSLGVDDVDVTTDGEGNTDLRLGRYLSDNVYTDLELGSDGTADLSLNLDLTPDVTARGRTASDGDGSLGIFFERDY